MRTANLVTKRSFYTQNDDVIVLPGCSSPHLLKYSFPCCDAVVIASIYVLPDDYDNEHCIAPNQSESGIPSDDEIGSWDHGNNACIVC